VSGTVTLYTRQLCGLCDEALAQLRALAPTLHFEIAEVDIDADAGLRAKYNDVIPVIAVGDTTIAQAPIDYVGLQGRLSEALHQTT
jgi:hypothetical protein